MDWDGEAGAAMDDEDYMEDSPAGYRGPQSGWTGAEGLAQQEDDEPEEPNALRTLR